MPKALASTGFIAITNNGSVISLLGPDGPVPCAGIEVDSPDSEMSPYRIEAVLPKREYVLEQKSGDSIDAAFEDVVPLARTVALRDIKVGDEVLYRDEAGWHSETASVVDIRYRFEHLVRAGSGKVFSVVLDHDILCYAAPDGKTSVKSSKVGRKRSPRKAATDVVAVESTGETV